MENRRNIESTNTNWCTLAVRCSGQIDVNVNVAWPVYGYLPLSSSLYYITSLLMLCATGMPKNIGQIHGKGTN